MNSRITIKSKVEVNIKISERDQHFLRLYIGISSQLQIEPSHSQYSWYDNAGLDALGVAIACFRQTGSFAALSDESAVPFVGKEVCYPPNVKRTISEVCGSHVLFLGSRDWVDAKELLPLTPAKPKVRPYTPVEAAAHLGREFVTDKGNFYILRQVSAATIVDPNGVGLNVACCMPYSEFATCLWADSREPCGVPEPN